MSLENSTLLDFSFILSRLYHLTIMFNPLTFIGVYDFHNLKELSFKNEIKYHLYQRYRHDLHSLSILYA